ncbi:MAG: hypothetical protein ACWGQW_07540 [bacterium]
MVKHVELTDPYLHVPKGCSSATAGDVYVADGAGSGAWTANLESFYEGQRHYIQFSGPVQTTAWLTPAYYLCGYSGRVIRASARCNVDVGATTDTLDLYLYSSGWTIVSTITITNGNSFADEFDIVSTGYSDASWQFSANDLVGIYNNGETAVSGLVTVRVELLLEA